jgi:hypothetical protein
MADITLENGSDGLFDILNNIFRVQTQVDASVADRTLEMSNLFALYGSEFSTSGWVSAVSSAQNYSAAELSSPSQIVSALKSMAEVAVIEKVDEAVNLVSRTIDAALIELVSQMNERAESLQTPAITIATATDGGNTGDCIIIASKKTTGGVDNPQLLAEVIEFSAVLSSSLVVIQVTSDATQDGLAPDGFGGSGLNGFISYFTTNSGLTGTSGLNAFTTSASTLPGSWIANVGTLGTAVLSGMPQVSTITVTGTPTSGTYRITCQTTNLGTQSTGNLPYNATAAQIQTAIAAMSGFANVSVSATGSTPDYVHSLTFYGMRESVTVAVVNSTNTGSFAVATPTAYAAPSLGSSPIVLVSDNSTLVSVSHLLTHLQPNTAYAVNCWLAVDSAAASGVVEVSLTNGVGGTIIQDDAGNDLKYTVNATDLATTYNSSAKLTSGSPVFNTPAALPASVYLRIRASTTLPNTRKLFIENPVVAAAVRLYVGGPFVAFFAGPTGPKSGDEWTVTTTNDYAGKTSFGMERNFGLRGKSLLIPHSGSPTITDLEPVESGPGTATYAWDDANSEWDEVVNSCAIGYVPDPPPPELVGLEDGQLLIRDCVAGP